MRARTVRAASSLVSLSLLPPLLFGACGDDDPGTGSADAAPPGDGATGDGATTGVDASTTGDAGSSTTADVFAPSTRFTVIDPTTLGAAADGSADVTDALEDAVAALPAAGGIVLFPAGTFHKQERLWIIQKDHVLLWAPNGRATLHGTIRAQTPEEEANPNFCGVRQQSTIFRNTLGGGVYGLRFTSNADHRDSCGESNQIMLDSANSIDVVGVELDGSAGCGVFARHSKQGTGPSQNLFLEGNYVHHTHADSLHHTGGTRRSWVWNNAFFNESPTLGDDGIACVTYDIGSPLCGEMEWWGNRYLGGAHGRGMAVVGGEDISIHDNWIIGSAAAGLIVASESSYETESSANISMRNNWLVRSPSGSVNNGHPAILISGNYPQAAALHDIEAIDNVIIDPAGNRVERAEGNYDEDSVVLANSADPKLLPGPEPTVEDESPVDTSILRTRDVSFVAEAERLGLYRIHVREGAGGAGIEERFEYLVRGSTTALSGWVEAVVANQGAYLSEQRAIGDDDVSAVLVLSPVPLEVPDVFEGISFEALRAGDLDGTLSWLWARVDRGDYLHDPGT